MKRFPYEELVSRWRRARGGVLIEAGRSGGFPLYFWRRRSAGLKIYLSAGIHGDEPAGPMAVTSLLEQRPAWFMAHSWTVFPCMNPWGYENGRRRDRRGVDLNRLWRKPAGAEARAVMRAVGRGRFDMVYLMHEDFDADGFYLYELTRSAEPIGAAIVRAAGRLIPLETRAAIEGRRTEMPGLVSREWGPRRRRRKFWPEAFYFIERHTDRLFTPETPSTGFSLALRVRAQLAALEAAVRALQKRP